MSGRFPPDPGFTAASGDARASGLTVTPHVIFRNGIVWRRSISLNTVHLMLLRYTRPVVQPGGTNGTNGCGASQWEPDHGLHQPRGVEHDDPADRGERSLGGVESAEYPSTGLARARDGLLRGRVGAVHAVVVPRGLALPAGRPAVVERPVGTPPGGGQVGYLASPDALGCRTAASLGTARQDRRRRRAGARANGDSVASAADRGVAADAPRPRGTAGGARRAGHGPHRRTEPPEAPSTSAVEAAEQDPAVPD